MQLTSRNKYILLITLNLGSERRSEGINISHIFFFPSHFHYSRYILNQIKIISIVIQKTRGLNQLWGSISHGTSETPGDVPEFRTVTFHVFSGVPQVWHKRATYLSPYFYIYKSTVYLWRTILVFYSQCWYKISFLKVF